MMLPRQGVFIIARTGNTRHRILASAHHRFVPAWVAAAQCLKLVHIFSAPAQRLAVQTELESADVSLGQAEEDSEDFENSPPPFPFILNCLMVGMFISALMDPSEVDYKLSGREGFTEKLHGNAVVVIDISDLDNIRYCFVNIDPAKAKLAVKELSTKSSQPPVESELLYSPLTAWQYMAGHMREQSVNPEHKMFLETLQSMPLVEMDALASTWPKSPWNMLGHHVRTDSLEHTGLKGPTALAEQSVVKLVDGILSSQAFNVRSLDEPRLIAGFRPSFKKYLLRSGNRERLGQHPQVSGLLQVAYEGEAHLGWATFDGLSPQAIRAALQSVELSNAQSISLSAENLLCSEPEDLIEALAASPSLRELYLMSRPGRSRAHDVASARFFLALSSHPGFLEQCDRIVIAGACSSAANLELWLPTEHSAAPNPIFPVSQFIVESNMPWTAAGVGYNNELTETFYLGDGLITAPRAINGLFCYIHNHLNFWARIGSGYGSGSVASFAFASASPSLADRDEIEITTVPVEMHTISKAASQCKWNHACCCKLRDLVVGSWTLLLEATVVSVQVANGGHNKLVGKYKYAFVRAKTTIPASASAANHLIFANNDIEMADAEAFLQATAPQQYQQYISRNPAGTLVKDEMKALDPEHYFLSDMTPSEAAKLITNSRAYTCTLKERIAEVMDLRKQARSWYPELDLEPGPAPSQELSPVPGNKE